LRENREKVVYVDGNHDPSGKVVSGLLGVKVVKEYCFELGARKFWAVHGHRFDRLRFFFENPRIDRLFSGIVWLMKKLDWKKRHAAKWADCLHEWYAEHVIAKAGRRAMRRRKDVMLCGHVHRIAHRWFRSRRTGRIAECFVCGWSEGLYSFFAIDESGAVDTVVAPHSDA
jgi:UDP-2,3-diacylglucosamine pyrophosphatase LpxH